MAKLLTYAEALAYVKSDQLHDETAARTIAAAFMAPERPGLVAFATGAEFDAPEVAEEAYLENDPTYGPDDRAALAYLVGYCISVNEDALRRVCSSYRERS